MGFKEIIYKTFLVHLKVFYLWRYLNRKKIIILMYHHFCEVYNVPHTIHGSSTNKTTNQNKLARQVEFLLRHYNIIPLEEVCRALAEGRRLPDYFLAITIDDGYYDFYEIAYPIFREKRIPATIFIATHPVDTGNLLWYDKLQLLAQGLKALGLEDLLFMTYQKVCPTSMVPSGLTYPQLLPYVKQLSPSKQKYFLEELESYLPSFSFPGRESLRYMSWEEIEELSASGLSIGAHTVSHPILATLEPEIARQEIIQSKARLEERLGEKITLFCYPDGKYNKTIKSIVKNAGFWGGG